MSLMQKYREAGRARYTGRTLWNVFGGCLGLLTALTAGLLIGMPTQAWADEQAVLDLIAEGFESPVNFFYEQERDRIYVVEQYAGRVRIVENGVLLEKPLIEIENRLGEDIEFEEGLVGIAFPPDRRRLYLAYAPHGGPLTLSRFAVSEDGTEADEASEERLFTVERWFAWHHCGHIAFGPDGFLYVCIGDSDDQGNPRNSAQDLTVANGSIVRLDVEGSERPYGVPADNPFVDGARPEIWMYGLRNPWRFSFDALSGHVVIPDVGWADWEEINVVPLSDAGANFGWPLADGNECVAYDPADCAADLTWPVWEYPHVQPDPACSIIGGAIYRGARFPEWRGVYVFGDFCSGTIWAIRDILGEEPRIRTLMKGDIGPSSIGLGPDGDVILTDLAGGKLFRLNFPPDFDAGWQNLAAAHDEAVTRARRSAEVSIIRFAGARVERLQPAHFRMPEPVPTFLVEWYAAAGRPAAWQFIAMAVVVGLLLVGAVIALLWVNARLKSSSQGPPQ